MISILTLVLLDVQQGFGKMPLDPRTPRWTSLNIASWFFRGSPNDAQTLTIYRVSCWFQINKLVCQPCLYYSKFKIQNSNQLNLVFVIQKYLKRTHWIKWIRKHSAYFFTHVQTWRAANRWGRRSSWCFRDPQSAEDIFETKLVSKSFFEHLSELVLARNWNLKNKE